MSSLSLNDALPRRRSRMPWIIGGIVAMVVLLVLGVLASVVWSGVNSFNDQAYTAIRADPAIVDAVGKISDIHLDFEATGDAPGDEEFAYRIIGDRASGLLVGRFVTIDAETEDLREGALTLDEAPHTASVSLSRSSIPARRKRLAAYRRLRRIRYAGTSSAPGIPCPRFRPTIPSPPTRPRCAAKRSDHCQGAFIASARSAWVWPA